MKHTKFKLIWSLLLTVLFSANLYAINISVTNPNITADPIVASSNYTVSFDINNLLSTTTPEDAVFVVASLSGYDASNVAGLVSNTAGWTCVDNTITTGSIDCDRSFSIGEFTPGSSLNLAITLLAGTAVVNPDTFTIISTDEAVSFEDNFSDNTTSVSTTAGVQPDLTFNAVTTAAIYPATELQTVPVIMDFEVQNIGNLAAGSGITFMLNFDDFNFLYNATASTFSANWNCSPQTGGIVCSYSGNLIPTASETLSLAFDVGSSAIIGMYNFNGSLLDVGGIETNTSNNSIATIVDITAPPVPDLALVGGITPLNFNFTENDTTPQAVSYRIINNGADASFGVDFAVVFDDLNFTITGPTSPIPAGWACSPSPGVLTCSTVSVFAALEVADFTFDFAILASPAAPIGNYPNILSGNLQDPSFAETNFTDNVFSSSAAVNLAVTTPDFALTLIDIDGDTLLTSLDFPEGSFTSQTVHYRATNNGGDATSGATLSLTFDDFSFALNSSTIPLGWNCTVPSPGQLNCTNTMNLIAGSNHDLFFNFSPISSLFAGTFPSLDALISDDGGTEVMTSDNVTSTPVTVFQAMPVDLKFVGGLTETLFTLASGDLSVQNITYQIINNGTDAINGVEVYFTYDDANFSIAVNSSTAGWSCNIFIAGQFICNNFNVFSNGATADFQVQLTALPATLPGLFTPVVTADVFEFSMLKLKKSIKGLSPSSAQIITDVTILDDPDIVINKLFGNGFVTNTITQASIGSQVTYKILVDALGLMAATGANVQITDTLPAGVSFISLNVLGPNFNCSETAGTISCLATSLPITTAEDGVEITVNVTGNIGDVITNTANVSADNDSLGSNNSSSPGPFTVVATIPTTLTLDKIATVNGLPVDTLSKGGSFRYRLSVKNSGSSNALNLQLFDDMPAGVIVNSFSGSGWTCNNSGLQYTCDFPGPLLAGATTFLNFSVVDNSAPDVRQLLNVANVLANNAPQVSDAVFTNLTDVSLLVEVTQSPNPIEEGQAYDLIIDLTNNGSEEINGAQIANTLPDGFSYSNMAKSSTCQVNGQDMTCTIDNPIAVNSIETIVIGVQAIPLVESNAVYTNITTVSGSNIPMPLIVETITHVNPMGAGSGDFNYTIELTSDLSTVETNSPFNYMVTLENTGSLDITFMDVDLGIPSDLTVLSMMNNGFTCTSASFGLACSADAGFSLAPGETLEIINVEVQSATFIGDILVDLSSRIGTIIERNDELTTTFVSGVLVSDLFVEVLSGEAIDQGDDSMFEVAITNDGPDSAEQATMTMNVTGILDGVTVDSGSDWNCQVSEFSVDCQFNASLMPAAHHSSVFVTVKTTRVEIDAESVVLSATVETTSDDPNLSNNSATSAVDVSGTPTEGDIAGAIRDALGVGTPELNDAIGAVAELCEIQYFSAFEELCESIYDAALEGDSSALSLFLEEITPKEVIGQSTSLNEIALAQFRNIGARLNQVRNGGGSGFSSAGLNARYGSGSIPLGMLAYLNQTEEEASADINTNNDFISPWGFFVNGTISMGERDSTGRELGFDFDTFGLTAGVDYRIDAKKVVGVALGYANFDSKIEGLAELNSTGVTLTGYGSFYVNDNFYVDARISLSRPDFEQSRKIDFTIGDTRFDRTATGDTTANQYTASMSAGYSFYKNAWNITPNASFTYTTTNVDGFTESGAGDFNIVYSEQDIESLVWSAGIRVSKAVSLKKGVITPQFDFDYNYQGLNDESLIEVRFIQASADQTFFLEADTPDRSYGSAGLGLVYISANGKQAYFNYRSVLGLEGFSRGTFNVGARFEF